MDSSAFMIFPGKEALCPKHTEWIQNEQEAIRFCQMILVETFNNPLFKQFCGKDPEKGIPASVQKVPDVLKDVLPLCCFLGDQKVELLRQKVQNPDPKGFPLASKSRTVIENKSYTPIEFLKLLGWRQIFVSADKIVAESYRKGFADGRKKTWDVVTLDVSDRADPAHRQYKVWGRKIESSPSNP